MRPTRWRARRLEAPNLGHLGTRGQSNRASEFSARRPCSCPSYSAGWPVRGQGVCCEWGGWCTRSLKSASSSSKDVMPYRQPPNSPALRLDSAPSALDPSRSIPSQQLLHLIDRAEIHVAGDRVFQIGDRCRELQCCLIQHARRKPVDQAGCKGIAGPHPNIKRPTRPEPRPGARRIGHLDRSAPRPGRWLHNSKPVTRDPSAPASTLPRSTGAVEATEFVPAGLPLAGLRIPDPAESLPVWRALCELLHLLRSEHRLHSYPTRLCVHQGLPKNTSVFMVLLSYQVNQYSLASWLPG
jgi:hypothetical protein